MEKILSTAQMLTEQYREFVLMCKKNPKSYSALKIGHAALQTVMYFSI